MQEISVSMLISYLKRRCDNDSNLQKINVRGEISNFHQHFSGHIYFTLKDENASINCVMFKTAAQTLEFVPQNGDKVTVLANTSIYESTGQLQLYILKINKEGLGSLYEQYEALKNKLQAQGKFSDEHKIKIKTKYPEKIAILTGDKSAALSDIQKTLQRRWPVCKADLYPVLVQGKEAPASIIEKLKYVDQCNYDAIVLARGGGSFEDLFCFNDELLVNTIYDLNTFIITGIGHEQDFTLSDFVADQRGSTPTAAIELITPDYNEILNNINDLEDELYFSLINKLDNKKMIYDLTFEKLMHYQNKLNLLHNTIDHYHTQMQSNLLVRIANCKKDIESYDSALHFKANNSFISAKNDYQKLNALLHAYSVENALKRGYTLILQNNNTIRYKEALKKQPFQIRFQDGIVEAMERE